VLVCLETAGANLNATARRKCRPLKVGVAEAHTGWVKLSCTNTVGVSSSVLWFLIAKWALFSGHNISGFVGHMLSYSAYYARYRYYLFDYYPNYVRRSP
jgi:hypothetical protein